MTTMLGYFLSDDSRGEEEGVVWDLFVPVGVDVVIVYKMEGCIVGIKWV